MEDISCGLEPLPIPCETNCTSTEVVFPQPFRYVTRNIPGPGSDEQAFQDQLCGCDCEEVCDRQTCPCMKRYGPNYHQTNRRLLLAASQASQQKPVVECNSQCTCGSKCSNRVVQQGPGIRLKVAPAGTRGFGLYSCEDIERLTFVCEYAGEVLGVSEARKRLEKKKGGMNYLIVLREHCARGVVLTCVDPRVSGNVGRFANHSCDPNLLMIPVRVDNCVPRLALFARRDIAAGEELTFDYSGETVLEASASENVCESVVLNNASEERTAIETPEDKGLDMLVEERLNSEGQTRKTDVPVGLDHVAGPEMFARLKVTESNVAGGNSVITGLIEEPCGTCSDSDRQSTQSISETSSPKSRKRKLSGSGEMGYGLAETERTKSSWTVRTKQALSDSENGVPDPKPCYCGSACCKGSLPFERFVFDT